jgi:sugar phosphate isomerase/epimerase
VDLVGACRTIGERLTNVHFSDLRPNPEILVMGAPSQPVSLKRRLGTAWHATHTLFAHHQMPGPEGLSLAALLHELARQGYDGPLTMEINPFALHAWSTRQAAARMSELLAYVARFGGRGPGRDPRWGGSGRPLTGPGTMAVTDPYRED